MSDLQQQYDKEIDLCIDQLNDEATVGDKYDARTSRLIYRYDCNDVILITIEYI
jgi:hypothetical protein